MKNSLALLFVALTTLTSTVWADSASIIYLKDGSQIKGFVYSTDKDAVKVETPDGNLTINRDRIESIDMGESPPVTPTLRNRASTTARQPTPSQSSSTWWGASSKKMIVTGSFDIYGKGGMPDKLQRETEDAAAILRSVGIAASGSTQTDPGYGLRIGFMRPQPNDVEWGGSIGFVVGPQITQILENGPFVYIPTGQPYNYNGKTEVITETHYFRFLFEGAKKFPLSPTVFFRLGAGAGVAAGSVEQVARTSGSAAVFGGGKETDTWNGLTWEISPSFLIPIGTAELELGLRYAQFPKKKANETSEIRWTPLSIFAGVRFEP